jgi:hypothetical protein
VDDEDDIMGHGNGSSNKVRFRYRAQEYFNKDGPTALVVVYHWRELGVLPWSPVRGGMNLIPFSTLSFLRDVMHLTGAGYLISYANRKAIRIPVTVSTLFIYRPSKEGQWQSKQVEVCPSGI